MKSKKLNKVKVFLCSVIIYFAIAISLYLIVEICDKNEGSSVIRHKHLLKGKGIYYEPEYNSEYITKINEINLSHEGIKNKYQFVFITDLQASVIDDDLEDERLKQSLIDRYQEFVIQNPNQVGQEEIFDAMIEYTNDMNADALLLGGDIIDCPAESNFELLERELKDNLKVRYLYTLGNHDWSFNWDYHSKETEETYYPRFKEYMDDLQVSYLEYEDLIILSINDGKEQFEEKAIRKVKRVLEKKKPTIVMIHVPISTKKITDEELKIRDRVTSIGEYGIEPTETSQEIMDLILSDEYDVFYVIAGHLHFGIKDNLNERVVEEVGAPAFQGVVNVIKIDNQEVEEE